MTEYTHFLSIELNIIKLFRRLYCYHFDFLQNSEKINNEKIPTFLSISSNHFEVYSSVLQARPSILGHQVASLMLRVDITAYLGHFPPQTPILIKLEVLPKPK